MLHNLQFALKMIKKRPLRMGLTLLQVALGVAAITIVLSFIFSVLQGSNNSFQKYLLQVEYGKEIKTKFDVSRTGSAVFTTEMVDAILQKSNYIKGASIVERMYSGKVIAEGISYRSDLFFGVGDTFSRMLDLQIQGNFFTRSDVVDKNRVTIISDLAARQLFGKASPLGKKVSIGFGDVQRDFTIIGVFPAEELADQNLKVHFLLPYTLLQMEGDPGQSEQKQQVEYTHMWVAYKPGKLAEAKAELNALVKQEKGAEDESEKGMALLFTAMQQEELIARRQVVKTFGLFLGSFAFVSMVISAMGIVSMMLVSIVERTREIGLRRALGANRWSIVGQVISEAMMVSLIGGFLGIMMAWICVKPLVNELLLKGFFQQFLGSNAKMSWPAVGFALLSVILVGLVAGLYPGIRASRLVPVEAIREG